MDPAGPGHKVQLDQLDPSLPAVGAGCLPHGTPGPAASWQLSWELAPDEGLDSQTQPSAPAHPAGLS